jgi:hypothetical protein
MILKILDSYNCMGRSYSDKPSYPYEYSTRVFVVLLMVFMNIDCYKFETHIGTILIAVLYITRFQ